MARFGQVHHDGTPFPGGIEDGVGRLSDRTVRSCRMSLQWAVDMINAATGAAASSDVIDMVAAFVEPEVSAVAAFLRERYRDTGEAPASATPTGSDDVPLALDISLTGCVCSCGASSLSDVPEVREGSSAQGGDGAVRGHSIPGDGRVGDEHARFAAVGGLNRDPAAPVMQAVRDVSFESAGGLDVKEVLDVVDAEARHGHDASPSAGERAEPGLASTASVEGEPAAGGPFAGSPVADLRTALMKQAELLHRELWKVRRTPDVVARIRALRDALSVLTDLPLSYSTGAAFFYAGGALAAADAALAEEGVADGR